MTFKQATSAHLQALAARGWAVKGTLKVPHATAPGGSVRLFFKAQAVYACAGGSLAQARSLHVDPREVSTDELVWEGTDLAQFLG